MVRGFIMGIVVISVSLILLLEVDITVKYAISTYVQNVTETLNFRLIILGINMRCFWSTKIYTNFQR